ncbi:hypothetical protein BA893_06945 [Vibrio natriegens]|uniref:hypothetical protein n=1 Tax=Vibrio natriegens TaxID=691 RepID=UPI000803E28B|nr:hypothetical protein [Vibrio natriegens]ANQ21417.1 hypothetical protein BA893_06945 [Vibrio natriegens]
MSSLIGAAVLVCDSILANRVAHNARNELYHFLMAVNTHGLKAVVDEATGLLESRGYTYLNASRMSIERATLMLEMATGTSTYQNVRNTLDERGLSPVHHTSKLDCDY